MNHYLNEKTCNVKVSIVIPVYNQYESLLLVLNALTKQSISNLLYEVIIIDDGSNDALKDTTASDFDELGLKIKIIHQKNLGRAASRNSGVKISSGNIIIFCDADRVPDTDFVKEHLAWHNMGRNIVIGYPYDFYGKRELLSDCINWKQIKKYSRLPAYYSKIFDSYFGSIKSNSNLSWLSFLVGNSSISKTVFEKNNGFDETFKEWGFEHFEFAFRLYKNNETFYLNSKACNFHIPHKRKENFYQQSIKNNVNKIHNMHEEINCDVLLNVFFGDTDLRELEKNIINKVENKMDRKEILYFINKILEEELNINYGPFTEEKTTEYIGLDSLGLMTLIVYLEETIKCKVDLENILLLNNTITIANIIDNVVFED